MDEFSTMNTAECRLIPSAAAVGRDQPATPTIEKSV
jgi:hypothetical protein